MRYILETKGDLVLRQIETQGEAVSIRPLPEGGELEAEICRKCEYRMQHKKMSGKIERLKAVIRSHTGILLFTAWVLMGIDFIHWLYF